ncbi:trypsin-like peptidase domain-containing protein [Rheinheimera sp.]|uniref:trypsin-like peptidase domain-containing protein n=1 Tax=Rheinheimera sp. TaxID=1869214 RepID=UPI00307E996A
MSKILFSLLRSIAYGLAAAMIWLIFFSNTPLLFTSAEQAKAEPVSYARAVRSAAPAVVNVYTKATSADPRSYQNRTIQRQELGSGVIMNAQGYILTNYHVVYGADQISVALQDGRVFDAVLIGQDQLTDLAVLYVEASNLPVIPQDASIDPQVGDLVLAIGNPFNLGQAITQGVISATGRAGLSPANGYADFMQMDAAINAGNSGGALINSNGTLVGINTAAFQRQRNQDIQGIFFAVPYKLANSVLQKLIQHGRVIRGYLGVSGDPVVNQAGEPLISTAQTLYGVRITSIEPLSPAAIAGIKTGDILRQINGVQLSSVHHALDIIAETAPNSTLNMLVDRQGQNLTIPVVIQELN